jgi:hypothetical protein
LSGVAILNIVHHCAVSAIARQSTVLDLKGLEAVIQREYVKDGKIV